MRIAATCVLLSAVATESGAQQLNACAVPPTGTLYLTGLPGLPAACRSSNHIPVQWNIAGPAGPVGPQGPAGPQGPQGPEGPSFSLTGTKVLGELEFVTSEFANVPAGQYYVFDLQCPGGKKAIAGGHYQNRLHISRPGGPVSGDPTIWQVQVLNDGGTAALAIAYAVCAREF